MSIDNAEAAHASTPQEVCGVDHQIICHEDQAAE